MPFVPTDVPNGAVVNWDAHIDPNLTDARTWLNDIPSTDLAQGVIRREHLVRPAGAGFPQNGQSGMLGIYSDPNWLDSFATWRRTEFGAQPNRELVAPKFADPVNGLWWCRAGKTIYVPRAAYVNITCTFDMAVRADNQAGTAVFYPDGAGGPAAAALGGYFALHEWSWPDQDDDELTMSRRDVFPLDISSAVTLASYQDDVFMFASQLITSAKLGEYTYQLVYHADTVPSDIDQIDLTNIQFIVEVL